VTVRADDGSGMQPVAGAMPVVSVSPAPTSVDDSDCADGTDASGQCMVVINSDGAGTFTANAGVTLTVAGVELTRSTSGDSGPGGSGPATKDYISSGIAIDKVADPTLIYTGETVNYGYVVTNPGTNPLSDVTVVDDKCSPVSGPVELSGNGDALLDPGEQWQYTCSTAVSVDTVNTATATGIDTLQREVSDTDTASVDVISPAIEVTKEADVEAAVVGDTITYSIMVENVGDDPISSLVVTDSLGIAVTYVSGDADGDGRLDVGEAWSFVATYGVTSEDQAAGLVVNTATAAGKDSLGGDVSDDDSVEVVVESKGPPTDVNLVEWRLAAGFGSVVHEWVTASESDMRAFRLYRARSADRSVAEEVVEVPAQGSAGVGHRYSYTDGGLAVGRYYYWLIEVGGDGSEEEVAGPRVVSVGGRAAGVNEVFLPLLRLD